MDMEQLTEDNAHLKARLHEMEAERNMYHGYAAENKRNWIVERHKRIAYQGVLIGLAVAGLVITLLNILCNTGAL